ncbi:MAG: hypothetical protein R3F60_14885 [bacterium]
MTPEEIQEAAFYNEGRGIHARFKEGAPTPEEFAELVARYQGDISLGVDGKFGPATEGAAWQDVQAFRAAPQASSWGSWFDSVLLWPQAGDVVPGDRGSVNGGGSAGGGSAGGGGGGGGGGAGTEDDPLVPEVLPPDGLDVPAKKKGGGLGWVIGGLVLVGGGIALAVAKKKPKKRQPARARA